LITLATVDTSGALSTKPECAKAGGKQWLLSALISPQTYWFILKYLSYSDETTQQKFITHYEFDLAQLIIYTLTHKTEAEHWWPANLQAIFAIYFKYASLKNRQLITTTIWEQVDNLPAQLNTQPLFLADPSVFLSTIDTNLTDLPINTLNSRYNKLLALKQQLQHAIVATTVLQIDEKLAMIGVRIYRFYLEQRDQNHFRSIFHSLAALQQSQNDSCAILTTYTLIHHSIRTDESDAAAKRAIKYIEQFDPLDQANPEYLFRNHGRLPRFTVIELTRLYDELLKRPLEQNIELYRQVVTFILKESTWIDQIAEATKLREKIAHTYFRVLGVKQCTLDNPLICQLLRFASKNEGSRDTAWAAVSHNESLREKFTPSEVFTLAQQTNNAGAASVVLEYYHPLLHKKEEGRTQADIKFLVDFVQHFNQPTIDDAGLAQLLGSAYPQALEPIYIVIALENAALFKLPIDDRHLQYLLLKTLQVREIEFPHPILYKILEQLVAHQNHLLLDDFLYACHPGRLFNLYESNFTGACDLIVQTPKLFQFLFTQKLSLATLQSMLLHALADSQQREQIVQRIMTLSPDAFDGQHNTVINDIAQRYPSETIKALSPEIPKETLLLLFRHEGDYQANIEARYELRRIVEPLLTAAEAAALLHPDAPSPPREYREWDRLARQAAHSTSALSDGSQDEPSIEGSALTYSKSAPELRFPPPSIPIQKLVPGNRNLVFDLLTNIKPWRTICQIAAEQAQTTSRRIQAPETEMIRKLFNFPATHFPQTVHVSADIITIDVSIENITSVSTHLALCQVKYDNKFQVAMQLLAELCATPTDLSVILETGGTPWAELLLYGSDNKSIHTALFNHLTATQNIHHLSAGAFRKMLKIIGFSSPPLIALLQDKKFASYRSTLIEFILFHHASTLTVEELQATLRTLQPDDFSQPEDKDYIVEALQYLTIEIAELVILVSRLNAPGKNMLALSVFTDKTQTHKLTTAAQCQTILKAAQPADQGVLAKFLETLATNDNIPTAELIKLISAQDPPLRGSFALQILQNTTHLSQCTKAELEKLVQTLDEQATQQLLQWLPSNMPQDAATDCRGFAQLALVVVNQHETKFQELLPLCLAEPNTTQDLITGRRADSELHSNTFARLLNQLDVDQRTRTVQQLLIKTNGRQQYDGLRYYTINYLAVKPHCVNLTALQQHPVCQVVLRQLLRNSLFLEQILKTPADGIPAQYAILAQFPIDHIISDDAILRTFSRYPRLSIDLITTYQANLSDALLYRAHERTDAVAQLTYPTSARAHEIFVQLLKHVAFDNFYCQLLPQLPTFTNEEKTWLIVLYLNQHAATLSGAQITLLLCNITSMQHDVATPLDAFNRACLYLSNSAAQIVARQLLKDPAFVMSIASDNTLAQLIRQYAPTTADLQPLIHAYDRSEADDRAQFLTQRSRLALVTLMQYDALFLPAHKKQRNTLLGRLSYPDTQALIHHFVLQLLNNFERTEAINIILHALSQHSNTQKHIRRYMTTSDQETFADSLAYFILRYCQNIMGETSAQMSRRNIVKQLINIVDNLPLLTLLYNSNDFETKKHAKLKLEKMHHTTLTDHQNNISTLDAMIRKPDRQIDEAEKIQEICAIQFLEKTLRHLQYPQTCWATLVPANTSPLQILQFLQIALHPAIAARLTPQAQTYLKAKEQETLNNLHADKNPLSRWWKKFKYNASQWWARKFYSDIDHAQLHKTLAKISSTQATTLASLGGATERPALLRDEGSVNAAQADQTIDKRAATAPQPTTQPGPCHIFGMRRR